MPHPSGTGLEPVPASVSWAAPRVWQGVTYRPLSDPVMARPLFDFVAVPWPSSALDLGWGAWSVPAGPGPAPPGDTLVAAVVGERAGATILLHGPVVITDDRPLEAAAQLVAAVLDQAVALGVTTVFARPQGLDRIWVRFGFIPLPESTLPDELRGRPGDGLHGWRGGTALWTLRQPATG